MSGGWTELGPGIHVRQSRAFAMNSVLLLDRSHAVVVDPGVLPSELDELAQRTSEARANATTLFLTHAHWDHVLGRPWFPNAATLGHDRLATEMRNGRAAILAEAKRIAAEHGESWTRGFEPFLLDEPVSGLRFEKRGDWKLVFRDAPGHSSSALTLHVPDHALLIAGDLLSDEEIPALDGPPTRYRATIEALWPLVEGGAIETLIPGHGSIARGRDAVRARFDHDLQYLSALDRQVSEARAGGLSLDETTERLAAMEYTGKHGPHDFLRAAHAENVSHAWREASTPRSAKRPAPRGARGR